MRKGARYRVQEFAALAGVTVKTLHHYDRIGLLRPRRAPSGYRVYMQEELVRLEQILALKTIGFSLTDIRSLLERDALPLPALFRQQRHVLEEKRRLLDRAFHADRCRTRCVVRIGADGGNPPGRHHRHEHA